MPSIKLLIVTSISLFFLHMPSEVLSEIFKCKTANGQTLYSSTKCAANATTFTPSQPIKLQPPIDIYITEWCPYCKKAMAYLRSKNVAFNVYDVEKNPQAKRVKRKLAPGYAGIPLTVINGSVLRGFSKNRFDQALTF